MTITNPLQAQDEHHTTGQHIKKGVHKAGEGVKKAGYEVGQAAEKTGKEIGHGAKKIGDKTVEVGSKGVAHVKDQVYKGKKGPKGQTIYIDHNSKYYWVNEKGQHVYISSDELRN